MDVLPIEEALDLPVALRSAPPSTLPMDARLSFQEGITCLQAGEAQRGVDALRRCVEQAPDFTDGHVFLGMAHALSYDIYSAIDQFETAARLDEHSFAAHFLMAQLSFKLRIPQKGYAAAKLALPCATTIEQRKLLTRLLREQREREHNSIARPRFNKPFSRTLLLLCGCGLATLVVLVIAYVR